MLEEQGGLEGLRTNKYESIKPADCVVEMADERWVRGTNEIEQNK